jgi:hypothetical protein
VPTHASISCYTRMKTAPTKKKVPHRKKVAARSTAHHVPHVQSKSTKSTLSTATKPRPRGRHSRTPSPVVFSRVPMTQSGARAQGSAKNKTSVATQSQLQNASAYATGPAGRTSGAGHTADMARGLAGLGGGHDVMLHSPESGARHGSHRSGHDSRRHDYDSQGSGHWSRPLPGAPSPSRSPSPIDDAGHARRQHLVASAYPDTASSDDGFEGGGGFEHLAHMQVALAPLVEPFIWENPMLLSA